MIAGLFLFRCRVGEDPSIFVQSDSQPFPEAAQKISRNLIEVVKLPAAEKVISDSGQALAGGGEPAAVAESHEEDPGEVAEQG